MDRFRELTTFVAVAEAGAFNAAARHLGLSPPAVTRLVTALETRLGTQLFTRTTRRVALTEPGARLLADARRVLADLSEAESSVRGATASPSGHLRLTAPVLFGERILAPILRDFLDDHPAVTAAAHFVDRNVNLLDEGLDLALRIGELPDSTLSARRVCSVRRVTVAAQTYIARYGEAASPEDLSNHRVIFPSSVSDVPTWSFQARGKRRSLRLSPALTVNSLKAAIEAAQAGWGVTRTLSYQVADALASGELIEILGDFEERILPVHLLHAEGRRPEAKIRSFVDFAAERLLAQEERLLAR